MLKGLELVGFKSFADRTRFEFPPGITVIVGPNGSGKSNVVDAIKWVLGEQSIKSLRGKEMADVIFNGSGSRGMQNTAEATLTFDNAGGALAIDAPEVHITRRVYRSGEGEYLINRQVCRLRDIRELFSGTGAATEAYSVIEQGKVDVLLQSSPKDRRIIFEEAAGISRFKVKKIESLRRLERVEQNLLRLADIVDEVDNQLRSVRRQAGKAERYREYSDRLKRLRLASGAMEWRAIRQQREQLHGQAATLRAAIEAAQQSSRDSEARAAELESQQQALGDAYRETDGRIAQQRERIAAREATVDMERSRLADLERERHEQQARYSLLAAKADGLELQRHELEEQLTAALAQRDAMQQRLVEQQQLTLEVERQIEHLRRDSEQQRAAYMNLMRTGAAISNQITAQEQRATLASEASLHSQQRIADLQTQLAEQAELRAQLETQLQQCEAELLDRQQSAGQAQAELREISRQQDELLRHVGELRERHSAARERAAVLQELEDRFEGIGTSAKELLLAARGAADGPYAHIKGMVADLLQVTMESAPLIDAALGPLAQYLVISSGRALDELLEFDDARLASRVGLVRLDAPQANNWLDVLDLTDAPGVLGRADRFVEAEPELQPLVQRLLGRTWIVESRQRAIELAQSTAIGVQLVTLAGEVIGPDGLLSLGPLQSATGLLSRRSELRALREQIAALESQVRQGQTEAANLKTRREDQAARVERRMAEQLESQHRATELRSQCKELSGRASTSQQQLDAAQAEFDTAQLEQQRAAASLLSAREQLAQIEEQLAEMDESIGALSAEIEQHEQARREHTQQSTASEIALAKSNEQLARLHTLRAQLDDSHQERQRLLAEHDQQVVRLAERVAAVVMVILRNEAELAELYLGKEQVEARQAALDHERNEVQHAREALSRRGLELRQQMQQQQDALHQLELSAREIELEMNALAGRLREDYQAELSELADDPECHDERPRDEVEAEIHELRRKINQMGAVNLEALEELEELAQRHAHLSGQYQDLSQAKTSLEHIIGRINADSRRLMAETFETVRGHFQELFAKLFGGGHADILLDEDVDILESGIEIVARPPGKEPRSISLLSGGEKTLTCVALLLAVFRSRPSPFCVLDEVDAALDEANIERFVGVLQEFLTWTQFIIVTHSKRTMTCAHTLYGVTMQESGVSKRVSVRFEDVSETGEILHTRGDDYSADETAAA